MSEVVDAVVVFASVVKWFKRGVSIRRVWVLIRRVGCRK
jgi:hypothetical protein